LGLAATFLVYLRNNILNITMTAAAAPKTKKVAAKAKNADNGEVKKLSSELKQYGF